MKSIKEKLAYLISGGLLVAVGMTLSPVTAQKDKFGEIECTKLTVVDANGEASVILSPGTDGGVVGVYGSDRKSKVGLIIEDHGGRVFVSGKAGQSVAGLGIDDQGGHVVVSDKAGKSTASLKILEHGGHVSLYGIGGRPGVSLGIDKHGGHLTAFGREGKSGALLGIDDHGGLVSVHGKSKGGLVMEINEYGNGAVSTFDRNGYRQ